tara:strand:- start:917 stop:1876 length:960 start_codon:yes stop_codon:yes gene_type:complete
MNAIDIDKVIPKYKLLRDYLPEALESLLMPPDAANCDFWPKFHHLVGGLRPREYSIICGPTGSGKTAWTASMIERLATRNHKVLVASVENGPIDFTRRTVSARVKQNWNTGEVIPLQWVERFTQENPGFNDLPIHILPYEDRVNNLELMQQVAHAVKVAGVEVVVLDNLNFFMEVTSDSRIIQEMDRVVHNWIIFCKSYDVHIFMVMHPKKTDGARIKSEFDIKGSSTAVQEAHNVFLMNRIEPEIVEEDPRWSNCRELIITKCRRRGFAFGKTVIFRSPDAGASYEEGSPLEDKASSIDAARAKNASRAPFGFRGMDE